MTHKKPPFRIWRILHQAKLARRVGDGERLVALFIQYAKAKAKRGEVT